MCAQSGGITGKFAQALLRDAQLVSLHTGYRAAVCSLGTVSTCLDQHFDQHSSLKLWHLCIGWRANHVATPCMQVNFSYAECCPISAFE